MSRIEKKLLKLLPWFHLFEPRYDTMRSGQGETKIGRLFFRFDFCIQSWQRFRTTVVEISVAHTLYYIICRTHVALHVLCSLFILKRSLLRLLFYCLWLLVCVLCNPSVDRNPGSSISQQIQYNANTCAASNTMSASQTRCNKTIWTLKVHWIGLDIPPPLFTWIFCVWLAVPKDTVHASVSLKTLINQT